MCVYIRVRGAHSADERARAGGSGAGGPTGAAPLSQIWDHVIGSLQWMRGADTLLFKLKHANTFQLLFTKGCREIPPISET